MLAYARHVDDLGRLAGAVERIAQKHVSLGVQPDQYAVVGRYLLGAIGEVLGAAATAEVVDAWTAAYNALASVFVSREAALYAATVNSGGPTAWATAAAATSSDGDSNVWRRFRVAARAAEAHGIDSFYLAPLDGSPLPAFLPGQYVSLRAFVPRLGHWQTRQYSLSQAPPALVGGEEGNRYRITVRRDDGQQPTHAAAWSPTSCTTASASATRSSCPILRATSSSIRPTRPRTARRWSSSRPALEPRPLCPSWRPPPEQLRNGRGR